MKLVDDNSKGQPITNALYLATVESGAPPGWIPIQVGSSATLLRAADVSAIIANPTIDGGVLPNAIALMCGPRPYVVQGVDAATAAECVSLVCAAEKAMIEMASAQAHAEVAELDKSE